MGGEHTSPISQFVGRVEGGAGVGRASESSSETRTSLASTDGPDGDAGSGDLKSTQNAWTKAGSDVTSMRGNIRKVLGKLEDGQSGIGPNAQTGQLQSAKAQREVYSSWKRYLDDVSARCKTLAGRMEKAGNDHYKNDAATREAFDQLKGRYADTPATGGQEQGG